jgi:SAM-dependent methyltransferase
MSASSKSRGPLKRYPFLAHTWDEADYIPPLYYGCLLKPYVFSGETDLEILKREVDQFSVEPKTHILELGCGGGRATEVLLAMYPDITVDVLDYSPRMIDSAIARLGSSRVRPVISDAIAFMERSGDRYDFAFSLWSLSHSVHQHVREGNSGRVAEAIRHFFRERLSAGAGFFLIHFDVLSEEQRITVPLWNMLFPGLVVEGEQSPSLKLISSTLEQLRNDGIINYSIEHLVGSAIEFRSMDEAIETYMNFHLESQLNRLPLDKLSSVIGYLEDQLRSFMAPDQAIRMKPGCFLVRANRA